MHMNEEELPVPFDPTHRMPAKSQLNESRTRASGATKSPKTIITSSYLRGESETPELTRDRSMQVETEEASQYGG